jgi:DNA-binding NarL/FixJ family response regulator
MFDGVRAADNRTLVERRRILLVDMPQLLRGIIRSVVVAEEDLEIVAEVTDAGSLDDAIPLYAPDVVIGHSTRCDIERLLTDRPRLKVLQVDDTGRSTVLYELRPQRTVLGEVSPARLLNAIRA